MVQKPRILTFGSATLDLFLGDVRPPFLESMIPGSEKPALIIEAGAKFEIGSLSGILGGGALNTARAINRFGLPVSAFFKIASDQLGHNIMKELARIGINTRPAIKNASVTTGVSIILPAPSGNKTVLSFRGANDTVAEQELPLGWLGDIEGLYISPIAGTTAEQLPKIVDEAKKHRVKVMHNPSIHQLTDGFKTLHSALNKIDILLLNLNEGKLFLDGLLSHGITIKNHPICPEFTQTGKGLKPLLERNGQIYGICDLLRVILAQGPKIAIVTNGSDGVYAAENSNFFFCPSIKTHVLNTVGAGDTFGATTLCSYLLGHNLSTTLKFGALNASILLAAQTNFDALLTESELKEKAERL